MTRARDLADSADKDISGTLTVDNIVMSNDMTVADDGKVIFGAGSDLQIYHDATNSHISNATGDLTFDVAGDIKLDADGGDIRLLDGGTQFGKFTRSSGDFIISSSENDKDMKFAGADGGADITALTLDMSDAGAATFNSSVDAGAGLRLSTDGSNNAVITALGQNKDIYFSGDDNGSGVNALVLDMSQAGEADFNGAVKVGGGIVAHQTNRGVLEYSSNIFQLRSYGGSAGSGQIQFKTGGGGGSTDSLAMTIDNSGNVGIGTSSPAYTLSVEKDVDTWASRIYNTGSDADAAGLLVRTDATAAHNALALGVYADSAYKMVVRSNGNVGIGTSAPAARLSFGSYIPSDGQTIHTYHSGTTRSGLGIVSGQHRMFTSTGATLGFGHVSTTDGSTFTEHMRIDSTGQWFLGKTSTSVLTDGHYFTAAGFASHCRTSSFALTVTRNTDDGANINIIGYDSQAGFIGSDKDGSDSCIYIANDDVGFLFNSQYNAIYPFSHDSLNIIDAHIDLGYASGRMEDYFAVNGTIQTSDINEKQQIAALTNAEINAAIAISKLFKTFKWNSAVTKKGDAARTHAGVIAQEVETTMSDKGLDATKYAFWCSDTWWETQEEVAAVEAVEAKDAVYDDDGNTVSEAVEAVEAKEAYTRTHIHRAKEDAPEGATERNRKGIRYPELLSFLGAATEQRLTNIETRLTALEAN